MENIFNTIMALFGLFICIFGLYSYIVLEPRREEHCHTICEPNEYWYKRNTQEIDDCYCKIDHAWQLQKLDR